MGDKTMFLVVGALLAAYCGVLIFQGVYVIYNWIMHDPITPDSPEEEIVNDWAVGEIPRDYSRKVKAAMENVNALQVDSADSNNLAASEDAIFRFERLKSVRTQVARIRESGYMRGERDRHMGQFKPDSSPHPKGSGASQQWVRGYCQGQNIMDIKPYYDEA